MEVVKKVVLVGHFGVGKSSLVKRFVHQQFSDKYLTTIGVKIDKKVVQLENVQIKMMLWDIAGESMAMKIPKKYLSGAQGIIYVFDLSREETYSDIQKDLFEINKTLPDAQMVVLGNKADLINESALEILREIIPIDFKNVSAKNGENVEESFFQLAKEMK